jgi:hypothetical protein
MNDDTAALDQRAEGILTSDISDEALEAAAAALNGMDYTLTAPVWTLKPCGVGGPPPCPNPS